MIKTLKDLRDMIKIYIYLVNKKKAIKNQQGAWLEWLSCFGVVLKSKRSTVLFSVRAHAWVVG